MSDVELQTATGTVETAAEWKRSPGDFAKHWLQAIDLAGEDEKDWREEAQKCLEDFAKTKKNGFNILFANTQTTVPALYNSEPKADVRRRFGDTDPVGMLAAQQLERAASTQAEMYDLDSVLKFAVKDRQLQGRGVSRLRVVLGEQGSRRVECEHVVWDDFRRGPAKLWRDVPWVAYCHKMSRKQLVELAGPEIGEKVTLDSTVAKPKDVQSKDVPDMLKRATVWEVWDRSERKIYWLAQNFTDGALKVDDDAYRMRDFFPSPRPLYAVERTDTLVPICEYSLWKSLAEELNTLTARISAVIKVIKLRGIYDGAFESAIKKMQDLADGQMAPAVDAERVLAQGGIEKAIWMMPVDLAIKVVAGLYEAREQAKQALYEMTGVADIMRGQTAPSETLGAQRIKAQWGSLRLQEAQREVQRYARDIYRMMGDLTAEVFTPDDWAVVTGVTAPQQMAEQLATLLKSDQQREFRVDIETDSTIRADLSHAQENISGFVTGFGTFVQAIGPAVESGMMPPEVAVKLLTAFARNFKLGREAEDTMEEWGKFLEEKAKQPPQPNPQDQAAQVKAQAEQARAAADVEKTKLGMAQSQQEHQQHMVEGQQDAQVATLKHGLEMQGLHAKALATAVAPPAAPGGSST